MRSKHRGPGITISAASPNDRDPFTSKLNKFKQATTGEPVQPATVEWRPLQAKPHPRQAEIDAFNSIPSLVR